MANISFIGGFGITAKAWSKTFGCIHKYSILHNLVAYTFPSIVLENLESILCSDVIVLHSFSSLLFPDILSSSLSALQTIILLEPMLSIADASPLLIKICASDSSNDTKDICNYLSRRYSNRVSDGDFCFNDYRNPSVIHAMKYYLDVLASGAIISALNANSSCRHHLLFLSKEPEFDSIKLKTSIVYSRMNSHNPMVDHPATLGKLLMTLIEK